MAIRGILFGVHNMINLMSSKYKCCLFFQYPVLHNIHNVRLAGLIVSKEVGPVFLVEVYGGWGSWPMKLSHESLHSSNSDTLNEMYCRLSIVLMQQNTWAFLACYAYSMCVLLHVY